MTSSNSSLQSTNAGSTVNADSPWPGILSYREQDKDFFNGRDSETMELLRLVIRAQVTLLFGLSGLGKSSLLQAGLFPLVRKEKILPIYIRLDFSEGHPPFTSQVKNAIVSQAASSAIEVPGGIGDETLWEYFHRKDHDFWTARNQLVMPLLVFDQFEEAFTLGRKDPDFPPFLAELCDLVEGRPPASLKKYLDENPNSAFGFVFHRHYYKVLLSLREDFLAEFEGLRESMPSITHNRMRLQQMNGEAALEVVCKAGDLVEPGVAEQIVRFVSAAEKRPFTNPKELQVEPALLSVICHELNYKRQQRNESRISADLLHGTREEILSGFYERSINDLGPELRFFIEEKLVTVSGYRDSIALENSLSIPGVTRDAIDKLTDRRLIRIEERGGRQRIELTHDLLTSVISESRNQRHLLEEKVNREKELIARQQEDKLRERARHAKKYFSLSIALAILCLLALYAFYNAALQKRRVEKEREIANAQRLRAEKESDIAKEQRSRAERESAAADTERRKAIEISQVAKKAESVANQRLERIAESVRLRQAVLARNATALKAFIAQAASEPKLEFNVRATKYPYKSVGGLPTYKFQIYPEAKQRTGGLEGIALITYIMDHPTFLNPLIATGPDTKFTGTYDGVGCLLHVIAVIEYSNVDRPLAIAEFNMCEKLGK